MPHGEKRGTLENGEKLHEVPAAERNLSLFPKPEQPFIVVQQALSQHVRDDGLCLFVAHHGEGRHSADPFAPRSPANATLLKRQCHYLLGQNVEWRWGRLYRFDVPAAPQLDKPRSADERGSGGCEKQAVPKRTCASSGSTHPLKERRNRGRGVDLNDAIQVAYIDSKLKGTGGDDHAVR